MRSEVKLGKNDPAPTRRSRLEFGVALGDSRGRANGAGIVTHLAPSNPTERPVVEPALPDGQQRRRPLNLRTRSLSWPDGQPPPGTCDRWGLRAAQAGVFPFVSDGPAATAASVPVANAFSRHTAVRLVSSKRSAGTGLLMR